MSIADNVENIEHILRDLEAFRYGDKVFMTGPEWYDRWTQEFTELKRVYKYTDDVDYETIDEAAKRAAGLI